MNTTIQEFVERLKMMPKAGENMSCDNTGYKKDTVNKSSVNETTSRVEAKREDCSKIQRRGKPTNSALLESHYQSEHLQDIGMSRPICCYTSK